MGSGNKYSLNINELAIGKHSFSFEVDDRFFSNFEGGEITRGKARVDIALTKQSSMLTLDFYIRGEVMVVCDRCLGEFMMAVDYRGTLFVKYSEEEKEEEADVIWIRPGDGEVDLAQYIYDSIALSLPCRKVHSEGQCDPEMLKRFRIVSQAEFDDIAGRVTEGEDENSWESQLAKLKSRIKE